jgi:hypothetical protein
LVEQLTSDPEFKESSRFWHQKFAIKGGEAEIHLVEQSISDPMFKGLNPAATGTGKNNKKFGSWPALVKVVKLAKDHMNKSSNPATAKTVGRTR